MIKRILCMLCAVVFVFSAIKTVSTFALSEKPSLEITYSKGEKKFKDIQVQIHRVAKLLDDGSYEKIAPYSSYPVSIYDVASKKEWQDTALTLESYIKADKIKAYKTQKTDKNGKVLFSELETGLYLVCGVKAETSKATYSFDAFLIYLPIYNQDVPEYQVKVQPKSSKVEITQKTIEYNVVKLFKDLGNKKHRPKFVKVDILKDGVKQKQVKLSPDNNWTYSFRAKDDGSVWSVVEQNVSDEYKVKVTKNNTTFLITNTHKNSQNVPSDDNPVYLDSPSMGDNFQVMLYFVVMLVSGMMLIILGIALIRSNKNEQKE